MGDLINASFDEGYLVDHTKIKLEAL